MTATDTSQSRKRPARAPKPQGQWKVDGKDPLNPNEVFKKEDDALNVRDRILEKYSKEGFDPIPPTDLTGRFRWMGLYTQRKQGLGGRATTWVAAGDDVGPTWRRAAMNSCAKSAHVGYLAAGSLATARRMQ